jgi:transposase
MKKPEEVMEILEAYDLTGSLRQAAALAGCDHKTVAYWVHQRELAGGMPAVERKRPAMEEVFQAKIDELVDRSSGRIRADVAHGRLVAIGYQGSSRTTRRWVADSKRRWRQRHGRRTRPWIPEPGLWMQFDYGEGPVIEGRRTVLFCAWLAWSRFRVVVPLRDKTLPSVVLGLDRALRVFGGSPTYALTDNEKTVTVDHVAGIAVRNPQILSDHRRPRQLPARPSDRRQGGQAPDLTQTLSPVGGEIRGRQRGKTMATSGEFCGRQWGETDGH